MPQLAPTSPHRPNPLNSAPLLPLGAMLLAGSMSALAQQANDAEVKTLKPVTITEKAEQAEGSRL